MLITDKTRKDKIKKNIRVNLKVARLENKMREKGLRYSGTN